MSSCAVAHNALAIGANSMGLLTIEFTWEDYTILCDVGMNNVTPILDEETPCEP